MNAELSTSTNKDRVSIRLKAHTGKRLKRVEKLSRRTRTSLLEECLEAQLPVLEAQYRNLSLRAKAA